MKWRFRGTEVAGSSSLLWVAAFVLAVTHPLSVRGDTPPASAASNRNEGFPPGSLILRGPSAGNTPRSTTSTNASTAFSVVPASLRLPADLAEVVRLEMAGMPDDTLLAFIQNSAPLTPITPDQIVYLKDLGVSPRVLTALIEHQRQTPAAARQEPPPTYPGAQAPATPETYPMDLATGAVMPGLPEGYDETPVLPGPGYFNPVDYGYVYNALTPYGSWFNMPGYGWCWQPTVCNMDPGWRPYCDNGRWRWSDCGWYWDSQYTWGRVPFHYGRWMHNANHGWLWRPDRVWAPAWVSWRSSDEHYGWAPLPPGADYRVGTGWTYRGRPTDPAQSGFGLPASSYTFVDRQHFLNPGSHHLGGREAQDAFRRSTPTDRNGFVFGANQRIVNKGIDPFLAETTARTAARPAPVNFPGGAGFSDTGSGGQLPFNGHRHTRHSEQAEAQNDSPAPVQPDTASGTAVRSAAPAMASGAPPGAHVPQYPATQTAASLGNGPLQLGTATAATLGAKPALGAKGGLAPSAASGGSRLIYQFGKPGAVATGGGKGGGGVVVSGGGRK